VSTVTGARQLVTRQPLLDQPVVAVLTTVRADGRLQCGPMWFVRDGTDVLFSTMREFAKARRLRANLAATLLAIDPRDSNNWVELRGRVQMEEAEAVGVNDDIAERYTGRRPYFGGVVAAGLAEVEHPVTCRLAPATVHSGRAVSGPPMSMAPSSPLPAPRAGGCRRDAPLPADHLDLLDRPVVAALATRLPDGSAQTQPAWFVRDGERSARQHQPGTPRRTQPSRRSTRDAACHRPGRRALDRDTRGGRTAHQLVRDPRHRPTTPPQDPDIVPVRRLAGRRTSRISLVISTEASRSGRRAGNSSSRTTRLSACHSQSAYRGAALPIGHLAGLFGGLGRPLISGSCRCGIGRCCRRCSRGGLRRRSVRH
jgi:PPOX class probable F420-dependent enzyme